MNRLYYGYEAGDELQLLPAHEYHDASYLFGILGIVLVMEINYEV